MTFGVTSIFLKHFRNFSEVRLPCAPKPVIFTAPNGFGKTNLLEALSLFSPGRGLRSARFSEIRQMDQEHPWQVGIHLQQGEDSIQLGTSFHMMPGGSERRILKKEGEILKSQSSLTEILNVIWLTPAMDGLLSDGSQAQRQFIDRLTFSLFPSHAALRSQYDKTLRERMKILEEYGASPAWLEPLEMTLADLCHKITYHRTTLINALNTLQSETPLFPRFHSALKGEVENLFEKETQISFINQVAYLFSKNRVRDKERGSVFFGVHKTKLEVIHEKKNIMAEFCSTGEQKMLLFALVLAFIKIKRQQGLLLLMDDIVDHLDQDHRQSLLKEVYGLCELHNIQPWLTGNDPKAFQAIYDDAFTIHETAFSH